MIRRQRGLAIVSLIIVTMLLGTVLVAADPAALQMEVQIGLVGHEGGDSYAVALQGDYAYVGIGPRLAVLDVSTPDPEREGQSPPLPELVQDVAVSGSYAYVAAGLSGLHIFDVTAASAPQGRGSLDTPGSAHNVAVAGGYAYVADGGGGLHIADVSNPLAPNTAGSLSAAAVGGNAEDVAVAGNKAYVGAGAGGLVVVDAADPANPQIEGRYPGIVAASVTVTGTIAYVVDNGGPRVLAINVSNSAHPIIVDSTFVIGLPGDLEIVGSHLYLALGEAGMNVYNVNPATGEIVSYQATEDTPGVAHDVAAAGPYAYVADGRSGLRIVDVATTPTSPAEVAFYQTLGDALGLAVSGTHAYVAAGENGLSVLDVADPANPAHVGIVDTPGYAQDAAAAGARAYIADGNEGLAIADVTSPSSPNLLGQLKMPNSAYAWAVAVQGNYAYVAAESEGLQIVNVSTPGTPSKAGELKLASGDEVWDVAIDGAYAYLAAGYGGVRVVNISNPSAPYEEAAAAIPSADWAQAVSLLGGYAYVADVAGGLRIARVAPPASSTLVTSYTDLPDFVLNVTASGRHALLTTASSLHIFDVADPANPILLASHTTAGSPQAVAVGDTVLVSDLDGGLRVLDPADVAVSALVSPASPPPGLPLTLNITVANHGPSRAGGVQVVDTLPSAVEFVEASPGCSESSGVVTCDVGSLASGATAALSITVTPSGPGALPNSVGVSSDATEINAQNNTTARPIIVGGHVIYLPFVGRQQ